MSHSKGSKFPVDSYRNVIYDTSKSYKLAKALKGKQNLKVLDYYGGYCRSSESDIYNSHHPEKMKKRRKKNLCNVTSYSKGSKFPVKSYRNFKNDALRSSKLAKVLKEKNTLKLLAYYKNLCRSSKCDIHNSFETEKTTKDSKTKVNEVRSTGDDIEETFSAETIDMNMYKKIESTVEDVDLISESFYKSIVGYSEIRDILKKTVIWPLKKPETFKGLRAAPSGVLLFGPPGTGKSSLAKLIAIETNSTFFNISASSFSSKWMGESEKLVRVLFLVARARQPSIIFIDEVHGLLSEKTKDEDESTKRLKNEFLFCMNSIEPVNKNRIVVIGSTSRPQEIDERIRPKFSKRIYIPLPNENDREEILSKLLERECHSMEQSDIKQAVDKTNGFSILDLKYLCQEAAMSSIKSLSGSAIYNLKPNKIRPISAEDFESALRFIKPTVTDDQVKACEHWDALYGYGGRENTQ